MTATPLKPSPIKLIIGIVVAGPLAGALTGVAFALLSANPMSLLWIGLWFGAAMGALFGWPTALLIGMPVHHWLYKRNWRKVYHYLPPALVGAILPTLFFSRQYWDTYPLPLYQIYLWAALCGGSALIAALIFWLIRRPDRDSLSA